MADVTPFVPIAEFEAQFRDLSAHERTLAERMLQAAAVWIRDPARRPDIAQDDPMAYLVSFEVVRDAMPAISGIGGESLAGHINYSRGTDARMESGTLAQVAGLLDFTDRHLELLGLSTTALPVGDGFDSGYYAGRW